MQEYEKRKQEYWAKYGVQSFEQFADVFPKELFEKVNTAKKLPTFEQCSQLISQSGTWQATTVNLRKIKKDQPLACNACSGFRIA